MSKRPIVVSLRHYFQEIWRVTLFNGQSTYIEQWKHETLLKKYFRPYDVEFSIFAHNQFRDSLYPNSKIVIDCRNEVLTEKIPINNGIMINTKNGYRLKLITPSCYGNRYKNLFLETEELKEWYNSSDHVIFVGTPKPYFLYDFKSLLGKYH